MGRLTAAASRQGPWSISYWARSMATTTRSMAASVRGRPSITSVTLPASHPGTLRWATARTRSRSRRSPPSVRSTRLNLINASRSAEGALRHRLSVGPSHQPSSGVLSVTLARRHVNASLRSRSSAASTTNGGAQRRSCVRAGLQIVALIVARPLQPTGRGPRLGRPAPAPSYDSA